MGIRAPEETGLRLARPNEVARRPSRFVEDVVGITRDGERGSRAQKGHTRGEHSIHGEVRICHELCDFSDQLKVSRHATALV